MSPIGGEVRGVEEVGVTTMAGAEVTVEPIKARAFLVLAMVQIRPSVLLRLRLDRE